MATSRKALLKYVTRRVDDLSLAEDVVADVLLAAWRRRGHIPEDDQECLAFLIGIARRILANARRSQVRRRGMLARLPPARSEDSAEARVIGAVGAQELLARLGPEADLLRMAVLEGLSHAQMAAVLGCSVNAVAIRLHRARRTLAELVRKESGPSGDLTGGASRSGPDGKGGGQRRV